MAVASAVVGLAVIGGAVYWFVFGHSGDARDAIVVVESEDLYVVDQLELAANPPRSERLLRDVAVGGTAFRADGDGVVVYGPFDYDYEGSPLFSYSEDGDDEWNLAVVDGREVVDIAQLESRPLATYITQSGTYVIDQRVNSCSILRLEGFDTSRMARSDYCFVNPEADIGVLAESTRSRVEVSYINLGTGEESAVFDIDENATIAIAYSPTNKTMMLSGTANDDSATVLIDLQSGEIIAEDRLFGSTAIDTGFIGFEFSEDESTVAFVGTSGTQELVVGNAAQADFSPDGSVVAVQEFDIDGSTIFSVAGVEGEQIGPLSEVEIFEDAVAIDFIDGRRALVVDSDGLVATVEGDELSEIGDLRPDPDFSAPQIVPLAENAVIVSAGSSVGLVRSSDAAFVELEDLQGTAFGVASPDGRWLAISGYESQERTDQTLLLVDVQSLEWSIVDEETGFGGLQFSDDYLYFRTLDEVGEVRRVRLSLDERVEEVADGEVELFVPGEGVRLSNRSWDVPFLAIE